MRRIAITGMVIAAMTLAACGGSSKSSSTGAGNTSKSGGSPTTGGILSGNSDLAKLAGQYAKAKIKITYQQTGSGSTDTLTIAQDGNGKSSFSTGSGTFYSDGKTSVSCDGTGTSATCTDLGSLGGAANIGASFTGIFAAFAAVLTQLGGGDKSSQTIAGRDASCVKYKASDVIGRLSGLSLFKGSDIKSSDYDPNDSATICIDKKTGFVLEFTSTKKGAPSDSMTATAVSDPTDADFTPPVTPQTMPSISVPAGVSIPTVPAG